jgi:pyruvate/2-oxoglutarate dehydrogenase complex dihydrolipoamide acyltransferase (E2) component
MATSAQTLSIIIDELLKHKPADRDAAIKLLSKKALLPKKLTETPKVKVVSRFASKAAEEFAEAKGIIVPDDFKGTANGDKISVKDLKQLAEGPKKNKVNASPTALQFARDNGIDISSVAGTGAEGRVLLKDVKELKPSAPAPKEESAKLKVSPSASKLCKQHHIDEECIKDAGIIGSGKDGTIIAKDLKELIELMNESDSGSDSDSDSDDDEELFTGRK